MSTTAQILANRQNARFSTGPRTAAGIESSRHNATRHGLTGKQVVIKGEDPAEYDAFRSTMLQDLDPANEVEAVLAEEIIQSHWRLQRARRMEQQLLEKYDGLECITDPEASRAWDRLQRYMTRIERGFNKAFDTLSRLKKNREQAEEFAAKMRTTPYAPVEEIGFVLHETPPTPPASMYSESPAPEERRTL